MSLTLGDRVRLEREGAVARLSLARPEARNALDLATAAALEEAVARLADTHAVDPLGVVVIAADGPDFCVGGDLRELAAATDPEQHMRRLAGSVHVALCGLRELGAPLLSAVRGATAGGGLGLALTGHVVLAEPTAHFTSAYTAVGLSPDCGTSWHLQQALPPARTADLILTNRRLTATEAESWGLVSRVTTELEADVVRISAAVSAQPEASCRALTLLERPSDSYAARLDAELAAIAELAGSGASRAAVERFAARGRTST
jgi:2-(1,2-epoxy-1,2-dihydrophenyl)acetyl-CoA isomerase